MCVFITHSNKNSKQSKKYKFVFALIKKVTLMFMIFGICTS